MRRREFIMAFGGAAVLWSVTAPAQQSAPLRRIGMLMGGTALDQTLVAAFLTRIEQLGWKNGGNMQVDVRFWSDNAERMHGVAAEMLAASPDTMVAFTNLALALLEPIAGNVPIVFVGVGDPVGSGFVASLARPGGNITGFGSYDGPMGGKWLEVLKEAAPRVTRVMTLLYPETPVHQAFWHSIEAAAPRLGIEAVPGGVHDTSEIEKAVSAFAVGENDGLVVLPHAVTAANRDLIIGLALRHRLPAIYADLNSIPAGALAYYGIDLEDNFRQAAEYVNRILRGEKPADLPVQLPAKFKLVFNLKTARAIGLDIPPAMLTRADEVIE